MKSTYARRIRRTKPAADMAFAKKEALHDPQFFGASPSATFFQPSPSIQRKCDGCAEEEKKKEPAVDVKKPVEMKQGEEKKEEEKKVQKKEAGGASTATPHVPRLAGGGSPMTAGSQAFFAARMGADFSTVRIHTGGEADASAKSLRAQAYTVGGDIVFAEGKYSPETDDGKKLLAHELTHVIQQRGGERGSLQRAAGPGAEELPDEAVAEMSSHSGVGTEVENRTDNAFCRGHTFHGSATANYSSSFTSSETITTTTGCRGCRARDCITAEGTLTSAFRAAPTTRLPRVPRNFNACEREAAQTFIDTTLNDHENDHVAAFNTYVGVEEMPFTYTGCRNGLRRHLQREHNAIERPRRRASNAESAALDPFNATFPCDCP